MPTGSQHEHATPKRWATRTAIGVASGLLAGVAGCASDPRPDGPPADFAIGLTLIGDGRGGGEGDAAWTRSAWYLVEADGRLRAALGDRLPMTPTPPILRQLTRTDVAALWNEASRGGLANPVGAEAGSCETPREGDGPGTAIVYVSAHGTRSARRIDLRSTGEQGEAARSLARSLGAWAGVTREAGGG